MKPRLSLRLALLSSAFLLLPSIFLIGQGSLTPPGAPAPTMKTLDQIEPRTPISALPFTITAPGSHYVTRNLTSVDGQHGIVINADNVTLDLGGFELIGPGGAATSAVRVISARVNATVRNGTVRGWTGVSFVAGTFNCTEMQVENVRVFNGGGDGIRVTGSCLVLGNTSDRNGSTTGDGAGIHTTDTENRIEANSITGNGRGIEVDNTGSLIIKKSAATNGTDYLIAASNRYGAIINITAAGTAGVNGNTAASTLTSTDPWANFSY